MDDLYGKTITAKHQVANELRGQDDVLAKMWADAKVMEGRKNGQMTDEIVALHHPLTDEHLTLVRVPYSKFRDADVATIVAFLHDAMQKLLTDNRVFPPGDAGKLHRALIRALQRLRDEVHPLPEGFNRQVSIVDEDELHDCYTVRWGDYAYPFTADHLTAKTLNEVTDEVVMFLRAALRESQSVEGK